MAERKDVRLSVFVVSSSDGTLYGVFSSSDDAAEWALGNEEELGDWSVREVFRAK